MAAGYSMTAYAGHIGVSRGTLNVWMAESLEFLEAVSRAKAKCLLAWEQKGLRVADNGGTGGQSTLIVFGLKNMGGDEWFDKQEHTLAGPNRGPIQSISLLTNDPVEAAKEYQRLIAYQGAETV